MTVHIQKGNADSQHSSQSSSLHYLKDFAVFCNRTTIFDSLGFPKLLCPQKI